MSAAVNVEEMRKERKRRGSGSYTSWSVQATTNSASRPRFRLLDQQTNHEFSCRRIGRLEYGMLHGIPNTQHVTPTQPILFFGL
ncbi:hypothetical protein FIBSPDRAFT_378146 [Athelia psychrophila]|uniref:Uncharacterized protein n=1 Tax=Athelia psychrophila TaxID=1759441 RepID=A0A166W1Z3_9AGAM|nr:hypothetical protein FIBSPDRAFT_378146 [Fibularhizoctonia sp. CBS 109695]